MGSIGLMFALFLVGYLLGVWAACVVLGTSLREYEEGANLQPAAIPVLTRSRR